MPDPKNHGKRRLVAGAFVLAAFLAFLVWKGDGAVEYRKGDYGDRTKSFSIDKVTDTLLHSVKRSKRKSDLPGARPSGAKRVASGLLALIDNDSDFATAARGYLYELRVAAELSRRGYRILALGERTSAIVSAGVRKTDIDIWVEYQGKRFCIQAKRSTEALGYGDKAVENFMNWIDSSVAAKMDDLNGVINHNSPLREKLEFIKLAMPTGTRMSPSMAKGIGKKLRKEGVTAFGSAGQWGDQDWVDAVHAYLEDPSRNVILYIDET